MGVTITSNPILPSVGSPSLRYKSQSAIHKPNLNENKDMKKKQLLLSSLCMILNLKKNQTYSCGCHRPVTDINVY